MTTTVRLVPYTAEHVPTYYSWMQNEALRKATASEPLTLAEEYAMQRSWRCDADKLTFIICAPAPPSDPAGHIASMVGDVNLFLSAHEHDAGVAVGEIELMVAEPASRGRGMGRGALRAFVTYIARHTDEVMGEWSHPDRPGPPPRLDHLRAIIDAENAVSIRLFESVGFARTGEGPNYFGELQFRLAVRDGWWGEEDVPEGYGEAVVIGLES
ncbi:MAG: hypothetical protein M1832_005641 [Thelocarpon impressellum]|nr:MAG: hypothetical protein M1832_005641 [Thelocarpon impressellum]